MKRVVFSINDKAYQDMLDLQNEIKSKDLAGVLTYTLSFVKSIKKKQTEGYNKIILKNTKTGDSVEVIENIK